MNKTVSKEGDLKELMRQTLILSLHYKGQMKDTDPGATSGNNGLFQNFPGAGKCKPEYDRVNRGGGLGCSKRGLDLLLN